MELLERLPHENARSYAIRVLTHNIVTLQLEPGSSISENELSVSLNISRTPVREALIELHKQQLVEIYPQRGSYISKIDYSLIEETRFIRSTLENAIVELACEGINNDFKNKLHLNLTLQNYFLQEKNSEKLFEYDNEFHELLYASVNRSRTYAIIKMQMVHFDRLRALSVKNIKDIKDVKIVKDHENILEAIERGDKELAVTLMTKHLSRYHGEQEELQKSHPDYFL